VLDKGVAASIPLVAIAIDNMNTAPVCRVIICAQGPKPGEGANLTVDFSPADTAPKANIEQTLSRATLEGMSVSQANSNFCYLVRTNSASGLINITHAHVQIPGGKLCVECTIMRIASIK